MSKRDDGGQAFPGDYHFGMSLRAWLAGQALVGLMAEWWPTDQPDSETRAMAARRIAAASVEIADAMLDALKKED